ncbi:MAG: DNA-protecting protein DprA [Candidatus Omnitrophica bacterium]|nr:DNA-protecting protein DprA [Candidatus Omnitrophota bacterium]
MTEQEALVALNAVDGLGSARIRKLSEHFGSAVRVFNLTLPELADAAILPSGIAANILKFSQDNFLKSEYNLINRFSARVVTYLDDEYPSILREIPDFPPVLYVRGKSLDLAAPAVGVVGSRRASVYGLSMARQFSGRLAECGIAVVSGLARGVDSAAHRGALAAGGFTVGVLGCGLSHIYPPENAALFSAVMKQGAVISEFPMSREPLPGNFPRRNRIISGLSLGVIVVEAADRSGALITADTALEQGREVYAVPGTVDNPFAKGTNRLIKEGAKLTTSVEDILEDLQPHLHSGAPAFLAPDPTCGIDGTPQLSAEEQALCALLGKQPLSLEFLAAQRGKAAGEIALTLLSLERKKIIQARPGNYYIKLKGIDHG